MPNTSKLGSQYVALEEKIIQVWPGFIGGLVV